MNEIKSETQEKITSKLTHLLSELRVATSKMESLSKNVEDSEEKVALNELNMRAAAYLHDIVMMLGDAQRPVSDTLNFIDLVEFFCEEVRGL